MNSAILSYAVGPHEELLEIALPALRRFADRHGYDLHIGAEPHDRPPSWWKIPALQRLLDDYDEVLFVGADLVFVDGREDLNVPADAWQALVEHWTDDGHVPGGDFWLVRKRMQPILQQIWERTDLVEHGWWEQAALMEAMGYTLDRPTTLAAPAELYERTWFLDPGWNVHKWERAEIDHVRVLHATMHNDRPGVMREWAARAV